MPPHQIPLTAHQDVSDPIALGLLGRQSTRNSVTAIPSQDQDDRSSEPCSSEFSTKDSGGFIKHFFLSNRVYKENADIRYSVLRQLELLHRRRANQHSVPNGEAGLTLTMGRMGELPGALQSQIFDFIAPGAGFVGPEDSAV